MRSARRTSRRRRNSGTRYSNASSTRAATSCGRTKTSSTRQRRTWAGSRPARSSTWAGGTTGTSGCRREETRAPPAARDEMRKAALAMTTSVAVAATPHRTSFARLALRRILGGLLTLLVVSALVFVGTELLPGDAASAVLGRTAQPEQLAEMRELMGLDRPAVKRYFDWLGSVLVGDLGNSAAGYAAGTEEDIWDDVRELLWYTVILAAIVGALMSPSSR